MSDLRYLTTIATTPPTASTVVTVTASPTMNSPTSGARNTIGFGNAQDSFWDLKVGFIEYDLDLAASRWDEVNKKYEYEIYRKWGELKNSLFLIEEVEGEIKEAKAANMQTAKAEAKIKEARNLFEVDGKYAAARLSAAKARALLVSP